MSKILQEILEIPVRAAALINNPASVQLPLHVPYLGMGSSYFAPLAFKYMGIPILPELASEYFHYLPKTNSLAVILSQSGRSSEALWCATLFEKYIAITNTAESPLCNGRAVSEAILLKAEEELYSSSKTYINTLVSLFQGFGIDPAPAVSVLTNKMEEYNKKGKSMADTVFDLLQKKKIHGMYVTGSGPNIATAFEAALILSESTRLNFNGMAMAQYDHGPKETAKDSIVIQILSKGKSYDRTMKLSETIASAGAHVLTVEEPDVSEEFSIINNIIPFNFMAYHLAARLKITEMFSVGGKVTEVS